MNYTNMPTSDYIVIKAIESLKKDQDCITYEEIANACVVPLAVRTIIRAVKRLELLNRIRRSGCGRGKPYSGFEYEVLND